MTQLIVSAVGWRGGVGSEVRQGTSKRGELSLTEDGGSWRGEPVPTKVRLSLVRRRPTERIKLRREKKASVGSSA